MGAILAPEASSNQGLHLRIEMKRIDRGNIVLLRHDLPDGCAQIFKAGSPVLPAMTGDQDKSSGPKIGFEPRLEVFNAVCLGRFQSLAGQTPDQAYISEPKPIPAAA